MICWSLYKNICLKTWSLWTRNMIKNLFDFLMQNNPNWKRSKISNHHDLNRKCLSKFFILDFFIQLAFNVLYYGRIYFLQEDMYMPFVSRPHYAVTLSKAVIIFIHMKNDCYSSLIKELKSTRYLALCLEMSSLDIFFVS